MIDNYDLWLMHDLDREEDAKRFPVCACCEQTIYDETLYDIDDAYFHLDCVKDLYGLYKTGFDDMVYHIDGETIGEEELKIQYGHDIELYIDIEE